jgi:excisionase family DNA binding protein
MATKTTKSTSTTSARKGTPTSQPVSWPEVLTLEETAGYLRLSPPTVEQLALKGEIPGRRLEQGWRFLRRALEEWLLGKDGRTAWLKYAGAFADDDTLPQIRAAIYKARGRPEVAEDGEE